MKGTNLEDLMEMWSKDAHINQDNLAVESLKNPQLHSKYLNLLTFHNMVSKSIQVEYLRLKRLKTEYYQGLHNTNKDFLKEYDLEPIRAMILKQDIPIYLDSDKDLIKLTVKKAAHDEIVEYCKSVLKEITGRQWTIRNAIEFLKFTNGA